MTSAAAAVARVPAASSSAKRVVVVITGTTAAGKGAVALRAATGLPAGMTGEVVSADSVQVYRGLDVGADKTPLEQRGGVHHHLLDILDPHEGFSAGDFAERAAASITDVHSRNAVPFVVGGTGLYIRFLTRGRPLAPKSDSAINSDEDVVYEEEGGLRKDGDWDAAVEELARLGDPASAASIARNDWYRLRRAKEILLKTGKARADVPFTNPLGDNISWRCYFLALPREELFRRIDMRCDAMVAGGLLPEAAHLLELGLTPSSHSASRAIGYRQAMEYLLAMRANPQDVSFSSLRTFMGSFKQASRQYATRQLTWFRNDPQYLWLDALTPPQENAAIVLQELQHIDDVVRPASGVAGPGAKYAALTKEEARRLKAYKPVWSDVFEDEGPESVREATLRFVREYACAKEAS
eukprot:jgi/Chlat1/4485/Chrsp29S04424